MGAYVYEFLGTTLAHTGGLRSDVRPGVRPGVWPDVRPDVRPDGRRRRTCRQRRRKKNHLIEAAPFGRLDQM